MVPGQTRVRRRCLPTGRETHEPWYEPRPTSTPLLLSLTVGRDFLVEYETRTSTSLCGQNPRCEDPHLTRPYSHTYGHSPDPLDIVGDGGIFIPHNEDIECHRDSGGRTGRRGGHRPLVHDPRTEVNDTRTTEGRDTGEEKLSAPAARTLFSYTVGVPGPGRRQSWTTTPERVGVQTGTRDRISAPRTGPSSDVESNQRGTDPRGEGASGLDYRVRSVTRSLPKEKNPGRWGGGDGGRW